MPDFLHIPFCRQQTYLRTGKSRPSSVVGYKPVEQHVPVGEDQRQHLQLTRDLAEVFNRTYPTPLFQLPELMLSTWMFWIQLNIAQPSNALVLQRRTIDSPSPRRHGEDIQDPSRPKVAQPAHRSVRDHRQVDPQRRDRLHLGHHIRPYRTPREEQSLHDPLRLYRRKRRRCSQNDMPGANTVR